MTKNKLRIRTALFRHAVAGKFMTYGEFGDELGIAPNGLSDDLNEIWREESANGYPDITVIIHNKGGYPSQLDGQDARELTSAQKLRAREKAQAVISAYCPLAANPY